MMGLWRFLRLLAMVVWVGGLIFFAFVLAPTAFHTLPSIHEAGLIVGATLRVFDVVGMWCGVVFLLGTVAMLQPLAAALRGRLQLQCLLVAAMMLGTAFLHWSILPAMDEDQRQADGDVALLALHNPARADFDKLHKRSERVEGAVLMISLTVIVLMAREPLAARPE